METELRRGYLGTARRKGRQQTNRTYCHRATSRLYKPNVVKETLGPEQARPHPHGQSSREPRAGLRKSKIAQPPILAPRLYGRDPATKWIEHCDDYEPPKVHAGQRNAVSLRKKWKKCTDLVCRETLGYG